MKISGNDLVKVDSNDINNNCIIIPKGVNKIGPEAFKYSLVKSLIIPDSVTEIGRFAFNNCARLKKIIIPNSVTTICIGAFENCSSLDAIELPSGITEIGLSTFCFCFELQNIKIPNSVTKIDDRAFCYCSKLQHIELPTGLVKLGDEAFRNCISLQNIKIPNRVTRIGRQTFCYCGKLQNIELPTGLTEIGSEAFKSCTSLKNITIPNSITKISYNAFSECNNLHLNILTSLFYIDDQIDAYMDNIFLGVGNITIYGQKISKDNFRQQLYDIRKKELLDKIITYFLKNNIYDTKHFQYSIHKDFIESVAQKYSLGRKYYDYRNDLNSYMEVYIYTKHLRKKTVDDNVDSTLMEINDSINNHSIEELDTSSSINIINYGEELLRVATKIDEAISGIVDNYGPNNTFLEKELKKFRSPRNVTQYMNSANNQEEKIYLGKNSIDFLIYCNDYNLYRLNLGIKKLKELQSILKMYEEKLNGYKNNLVNYKSISINGNELHKMDDLSIEKQIEDKINSYTNQVILTNKVYDGVKNLINAYQIYMDMLEKSRILLEQIKDGEFTNKGVITDVEIVKPLNELLGFYESIDTKSGKKAK